MRTMVLLLCLASSAAAAELPLRVEDLLTAHHRYRFESSVEYRNREYSDLSSGYISSTDLSLLSLGLRWGWTLRTELLARAYAYQSYTRTRVADDEERRFDADWSRVLVGINHQFSDDAATPGLLGFATIDVWDKPGHPDADTGSGRNITAGLTAYRALDPLLLSAVATYEYRGEYQIDDIALEPGNSLSLSPQFAFAVNHLVTLTGGLRWQWYDSPRLEQQNLSISRNRTSLLLGLGYSWNEDVSISVNGDFAITDAEGSSVKLSVVYKFDDRSVR